MVVALGQMNHKLKSFCNEIESLLFSIKLFHTLKDPRNFPSGNHFSVTRILALTVQVIVRNVQIYFKLAWLIRSNGYWLSAEQLARSQIGFCHVIIRPQSLKCCATVPVSFTQHRWSFNLKLCHMKRRYVRNISKNFVSVMEPASNVPAFQGVQRIWKLTSQSFKTPSQLIFLLTTMAAESNYQSFLARCERPSCVSNLAMKW